MTEPNKGAQLLRAAGSIAATARKLNVSRRTIAAWRSSRVVPSAQSRSRIAEVFKIHPAAWDELAAPLAPPTIDAAALQALQDVREELLRALESGRLTARARRSYEREVRSTDAAIRRYSKPQPVRPAVAALALSASRFLSKRADEIAPPTNLPSSPASGAAPTA